MWRSGGRARIEWISDDDAMPCSHERRDHVSEAPGAAHGSRDQNDRRANTFDNDLNGVVGREPYPLPNCLLSGRALTDE